MATAPQLAEIVADLLPAGDWDGVLDLSGLSFIDAAGLRELANIASELTARGMSLTVTGPSRRIRRVFAIAGLDALLVVE